MTPWSGNIVATRQRSLSVDDLVFIESKAAKGYPESAIAKMLARPVVDIRAARTALCREQERDLSARPQPPADIAIPRSVPAIVADILAQVARDHSLAVEDILSDRQPDKIVHARHDAMWRLRDLRKADGGHRLSFPTIAAYLNRKDHTAVVHGVKAHERRAAAK